MTRVTGDGISLAVLDEGEGQPLLLLHGFPDSSRVWRHQVPALVAAGMRVIAPDLRGFGESDKPEAVEEYAIARSVSDMIALLDGLGIERTHVVGHDWGAAVAWALAATVPARVERLVAMSVGHPATARMHSIEQREKGWYQLLFQFTGVAEELLGRDDWKLLREILAGAGDLTAALQDLSRPGALTAALNWYRANLAPRLELEPGPLVPPVAAPTLGLWSTGDRYLTEDRMVGSAEHVTGLWRYARIEGASHWMQLDAPERVNDLLREFLDESRTTRLPSYPAADRPMSLNTKTSSDESRTSSSVGSSQANTARGVDDRGLSDRMVDMVARALRGYVDDAQEV